MTLVCSKCQKMWDYGYETLNGHNCPSAIQQVKDMFEMTVILTQPINADAKRIRSLAKKVAKSHTKRVIELLPRLIEEVKNGNS